MARRKSRYSGIGGQAVLEGVMMKNKEKYAVAVRKPDGEIDVEAETYQGLAHGSRIKELPFIRGIFNFLDSLILGTRALNYSASFYEEEDSKETKFDKAMNKMSGGKGEKMLSGIVTVISVVLAVGIFIVLPYFISSLFESFIRNRSLMAIIEGVIRIALFLLYVWGISAMKDIRRLYQYHGAEHKCINCIEQGMDLTVENVRKSSRLHKRCGTSFLLIVMLISYPHFRKKGYLLPFYMIGYGVIRCFVEGLRTDSLYLMPGVRVSQVLSGCLILLGVLLVGIIRRRQDIQV